MHITKKRDYYYIEENCEGILLNITYLINWMKEHHIEPTYSPFPGHEYTPKEIIRISKKLPNIYSFSRENLVNKIEDLKQIGKTILEGLSDNDYETEERQVAEYQGFKIILPAGNKLG